MQRVIDWFRNWPRWLKGGLLSAFAALVLYSITIFFPSLKFIVFAGLLPIGEYFPFLVPTNIYPDFVILELDWYKVGAGDMIFGIVSSFLFGALLGKIGKRFWVDTLLWILVFIIGWFFNYICWILWILFNAFMGAVIC